MNQDILNKLGEALMYLEISVNNYKNYLNNIKELKRKRAHAGYYNIYNECNEMIYHCNSLLDNTEK
jgi:hypothetical protein